MNADKLTFFGLLALGVGVAVVGLFIPYGMVGIVLLGVGGLIIAGTLMRSGRRAHQHRRDRQSEIYANAAQRGDTAFFPIRPMVVVPCPDPFPIPCIGRTRR